MSEARPLARTGAMALFAGLALVIVVARLLPLDPAPKALPRPDLLFCLTIAWVVRRPDLLPVWLLAPVLFLADLLLMRPPGLYTALMILITERLRQNHRRLQTLSLAYEVLLAGLIAVAVIGGHWLVLTLLAADQPGLFVQLAQAPMNAAAYPVVAALCHGVLGLRKQPAPTGFGRLQRA